jgi:hypothetical protein
MVANIALIFGMNVQMMQKHFQFAEGIEDDTNLIFRNETADSQLLSAVIVVNPRPV